MLNRARWYQLIIIATSLLLVTGCGFKLRGKLIIPEYLKTVYITPDDPYEPLQRELRSRLAKNNVTVVRQPGVKVTTLAVSTPQVSQQVLAYSSTSDQVQRYKLILSVQYTLTTYGKNPLHEQRTIIRARELSKSNNALLANENEEQMVKNELLQEIVGELLRQITTRPAHKASMLDSSTIDDNPC